MPHMPHSFDRASVHFGLSRIPNGTLFPMAVGAFTLAN